jgi:hypothetical protein
MRIKASFRYMAENEIAALIPQETMTEIKKTDPTPLFKAFIVGHEGEAKGNMIGVGNIVKRWYQNIVRKLHDKISVGLQLFHGHGQETNSHDGRTPIGRVVAKKLVETVHGLSSLAVCYINKDFRHLPLDVASIEADIQMDYQPGDNLVVTDVDNVSGIALGSSLIEKPGFEGATLLGQLQAFIADKHIKTGIEIPPLRLGYRLDRTGRPEGLRLAEEKKCQKR